MQTLQKASHIAADLPRNRPFVLYHSYSSILFVSYYIYTPIVPVHTIPRIWVLHVATLSRPLAPPATHFRRVFILSHTLHLSLHHLHQLRQHPLYLPTFNLIVKEIHIIQLCIHPYPIPYSPANRSFAFILLCLLNSICCFKTIAASVLICVPMCPSLVMR